jgi:hypothetical protein
MTMRLLPTTAMTRRASVARRSAATAGVVVTVGSLLSPVIGPAAARAQGLSGTVAIQVVSGRADLVSDGQALLDVLVPAGLPTAGLRITVGRRDLTHDFVRQPSGALEGLVTGLAVGRNTVTATLSNGSGARIVLTNHHNGGPLFAGPQIQPWTCQPGALDRQCNKPVAYAYSYQSTNPAKNGFQPYDPQNPPGDVAMTTTETGVTVPFIVRVETGYEDRDQYQVAALYQPGRPWTAVRPQPQFARKLLINHGGGCGNSYVVGATPGVLSYQQQPDNPDTAVYALSRGWAVMATTLDNNGVNCDVALAAESLLMAKQRVITQYGALRFTVGIGCSGGSLTQQWVANAYPGIYQGVLPACSFPDTWTAATEVFDYHLLDGYFENPSAWAPGVVWSPTQIASVEGSAEPVNSATSDALFYGQGLDPSYACPGTATENRYSTSNPGGVRCSSNDFGINVFGPRAKADWGSEERALGRAFAGLPLDNTGVQYGLAALESGQITADQFIDLNTHIGGLDPENLGNVPDRSVADPFALRAAYRSGMINEVNNYDQTAIIDCRGPNPALAHDAFRAFAVRARLDRAFHSHANQLIWEGPGILNADRNCQQDALVEMDTWLAAVGNDRRPGSLPQKIARDKPAGLTDRCYSGTGTVLADSLCPDPIVPVYGTPRMIAGDGLTTDVNKCRLGPLNRASYGVSFTDAQWATLQRDFSHGVCDFSKPGVSQQPTVSWMTYQTATRGVVYGGRPLGPAPMSVPFAASGRPTTGGDRSRAGGRLATTGAPAALAWAGACALFSFVVTRMTRHLRHSGS